MKVSCLQENLQWALGIVRNSLPTKALKPITENILIQTDQNKLVLTTTDLEVAITTKITAKVEEQGELTIPARLFINCIEALPHDRVDISTKPTTKSLYIDCAKSKSRISYIPSDDYPLIPDVEGKSIEFVAGDLIKILSHILFAAAQDDARPLFTGVNIRQHEDKIAFTALDGFRLSSYTFSGDLNCEATIPAKSLSALTRIMTDPFEAVEVIVGESRALFKTKNTTMITQLLVGQYPKWESLIPTAFATKSIFGASDYLRSVRSAMIFSKEDNGVVKTKFVPSKDITNGGIFTSGKDDQMGENEGQIDTEVTGIENRFAAKGKYLTDVLVMLKEGKATIEMNNPSSPVAIRDPNDENFVHLIMPMIIQW